VTTVDQEYWLAHCEGYRVVCPDGRVGTVLDVATDGSGTQAEQLIIATGLLRRRLVLIDRRDVEAIVPHRLEVCLAGPPFQRTKVRAAAPAARRMGLRLVVHR
jgi:hypothetical protein